MCRLVPWAFAIWLAAAEAGQRSDHLVPSPVQVPETGTLGIGGLVTAKISPDVKTATGDQARGLSTRLVAVRRTSVPRPRRSCRRGERRAGQAGSLEKEREQIAKEVEDRIKEPLGLGNMRMRMITRREEKKHEEEEAWTRRLR